LTRAAANAGGPCCRDALARPALSISRALHVGDEVEQYPDGTRARSRGEWYRPQVEGSQNFDVPLALSILCGALDRQIERHLAANARGRAGSTVAPELPRSVCAEFARNPSERAHHVT
jgi:linoleoyl-CoA desaturase